MKNKKQGSADTGGIGFLGILTIVFIVLKLTNVIDWSWLWVLAPFWIPWAIVLGILAFGGIFWVANEIINKK